MKRWFVGYGSLMSHRSLNKTIADRHFTPVILKGYKRVFNLMVKRKQGPDVLNLRKSPSSNINAVMFPVSHKELLTILKREMHYDLETAWAYDYLTGKRLAKCYVVIDHLLDIDKRNHLPNRPYFILCREAAYHISREFGEYWDDTTYSSSGMKIKNWLKNHSKYNTIFLKNPKPFYSRQ